MYNTNIPSNLELPSTGKLIKSTIIATVAAVIILVTVILPAEYGIDHTGIGNKLGLTKMGEIKMSLAKEAAAERRLKLTKQSTEAVAEVAEVAEVIEPTADILTHEMTFTLVPDQGTEIKVTMVKGATVNYSWSTSGGKANFDIHGDSKKLNIDYHNYSKGSEQKSEGVLEADFDGNHGWFWRNRTSKTMTVTLKTNGNYSKIKHFK